MDSHKEMRESDPVDAADFTKDKGVDDDMEFPWWLLYTLSKWYVIISSIK